MRILGASAFVAPASLAPAVVRPQPATSRPVSETSFGDVLSHMMRNVDDSLRSAERLSVGALTGEVPLQKVVETVVAAEQTVQLTTAVRDKIVAAYVELTRMPI